MSRSSPEGPRSAAAADVAREVGPASFRNPRWRYRGRWRTPRPRYPGRQPGRRPGPRNEKLTPLLQPTLPRLRALLAKVNYGLSLDSAKRWIAQGRIRVRTYAWFPQHVRDLRRQQFHVGEHLGAAATSSDDTDVAVSLETTRWHAASPGKDHTGKPGSVKPPGQGLASGRHRRALCRSCRRCTTRAGWAAGIQPRRRSQDRSATGCGPRIR